MKIPDCHSHPLCLPGESPDTHEVARGREAPPKLGPRGVQPGEILPIPYLYTDEAKQVVVLPGCATPTLPTEQGFGNH